MVLVAFAAAILLLGAQVKPAVADGYNTDIEGKVRGIVNARIYDAPGLIRLVFHDCWVKGCDASVLLKRADGLAEMDAVQNGGLRGLDVIQAIKDALTKDYPAVTCADAVVYAAREACYILSYGKIAYPVDGPGYHKDAVGSFKDDAAALPPPFGPSSSFKNLTKNFGGKPGFGAGDLVILSGAHAVGLAHRPAFVDRLDLQVAARGEIDVLYQKKIDQVSNASPAKAIHNNVRDIDQPETVPGVLDNSYYAANLGKKVLFNSDWALITDPAARGQMERFEKFPGDWYDLFGKAMAKLSRLPAEGPTLSVPRARCDGTSY